MVLGVHKAYIDSYLKLGLTGVSIGGNGFVELGVFGDFSRHLQIAISLYDLKLCLVSVCIGECVIEHGLHRCPHVSTADRKLIDVNGLHFIVVNA